MNEQSLAGLADWLFFFSFSFSFFLLVGNLHTEAKTILYTHTHTHTLLYGTVTRESGAFSRTRAAVCDAAGAATNDAM